jgi:glutamate racemase
MAPAPIGVFDSGIGGLSILRALRAALPAEDFVYFADSAHAPYGERSEAFVTGRTLAITRELVERQGIALLVVACNTATAAAVAAVREAWPQLPVVGVEPALKPAAAATRTGRIGVLATRGTLASVKFGQLHDGLRDRASFILQPCDGLAGAIEAGDVPLTSALAARYVQALGPMGLAAGEIDTLVLGCTHYPLVLPLFEGLVPPGVRILETGEPVARQARRLLELAGRLRGGTAPGRLTLRSPGAQQALETAHRRTLGQAG